MTQSKQIPNLTSTITKVNFQQQQSLPQSHQIAADIMREQIYNKKIKEKDQNYDEYLKQLQSTGTIEVPLVTAGVEIDKIIIFGDRMGGIYLYDLNKKMILSKKQISTGRRIISIAAQSSPIGDAYITTVSVIAKGDPPVYILRYKSNEQKLYSNYQIQVSSVEAKEGNDISDYPYEAKLSKYGLLAAVAQYNGSVVIYSIPEVKTVQVQVESSKKVGSINGSASAKQQIVIEQSNTKISNFDCVIPFLGIDKRKTYKQMIQSMKKPVISQPVVPVKQEKKKQPPAKGKEDKNAKPVIEQKKQQPKPVTKQFNTTILCPSVCIQQSKDYSQNTPLLKFQPHFYFLNQYVCIPGNKQFASLKSAAITTKLGITWTNTITYSIYSLRKANNNNIPAHLYCSLFHNERTKEKDQIKLELLQETKTIYPITATATSEDLTLLALGLRDGTVQIWDINTDVLKFNFDKHSASVKCLSFFEIYKLVSGGEDGSMMIHDLQTTQTVMKRTNVFQSKVPYSILKIKVNDAGVAFVLDSLGNIKIYDLWRNEKVGVLAASPPQRHTNKFKKWNVQTPTMLLVNDQLVLLSDNLGEDQPVVKKSTVLQIFKIFQSLLSIFDALSVIYRKGIDRQKVLSIFSNLSMNQLYQKTFQLPDVHQVSKPNFKRHTNTAGLETISQVPVSRNTSTVSKKRALIQQQSLQSQIKMFSRKRTPKMNLPNQEWLINNIREQHIKKDMRQQKLLNITSKTEQSFNS